MRVKIGQYFRIQDSRGYPYNPIFKRIEWHKVQLIESFTNGGKKCIGMIFDLIDDNCGGYGESCKLICKSGVPNMRFHIRKWGYRVIKKSFNMINTQNQKEVN